MYRTRRLNLRRGGNATVELSVCLVVLMSLAFGTVEFGHYYFLKNTLQGAAREGARAAIPSGATNPQVTAAVNAALQAANLNTANFTVRIRNSTDTADLNVATQASGTAILVKVVGTWSTVGVRPLGVIQGNKTVVGTAVMRKEAT